MAAIDKATVLWTGFIGSPGYTTTYWDDSVGPDLAALQAFFTGIADRLPSVVTVQVQNTGVRLESTTGAVLGAWAGAAQTPITGSSTGTYAAPSGAHINWVTSLPVNGRILRGRSFLVPLGGAQYDNDGSIGATALTDLRTNLATFVAAVTPDLLVWHRPLLGAGGVVAPMVAANIPDKVAVLRSRRD